MTELPQAAAGLVDELRRQGIEDERVLDAIRNVRRQDFVPASEREYAYANHPLPIGEGQTISQPYIVALMTVAAQVARGDRVLEIGTGCGYQTAVLAELGCRVYSVEIRPLLARQAAARLDRPEWDTHLRIGDGCLGWPSAGPFKAILITAAAKSLPPELKDQLAPGGRIVAPLGNPDDAQRLIVHERQADGSLALTDLGGVRFVPMTC